MASPQNLRHHDALTYSTGTATMSSIVEIKPRSADSLALATKAQEELAHSLEAEGIAHRNPRRARRVDIAVEVISYAMLAGFTLAAFMYTHNLIGNYDAGAPAFIRTGNKVLLVVGALLGTVLASLLGFLLRMTVVTSRRRALRLAQQNERRRAVLATQSTMG